MSTALGCPGAELNMRKWLCIRGSILVFLSEEYVVWDSSTQKAAVAGQNAPLKLHFEDFGFWTLFPTIRNL